MQYYDDKLPSLFRYKYNKICSKRSLERENHRDCLSGVIQANKLFIRTIEKQHTYCLSSPGAAQHAAAFKGTAAKTH